MTGRWLTTEQVADLLQVDPSTLRRWRTAAPLQGPPHAYLTDTVVRYPADEVDKWLKDRMVTPESHQDAA